MHHAAAQATAHKTINAGQLAQEAVYSTSSTLHVGQPQNKKHEESMQQLHAEANNIWKDDNKLVFQHQLHYDEQLTAFISDAERTLQEKQDKAWGHVRRLADMAGIPHDACLGLALQIPTIPIDLTYCMQIPMMIAYAP